MKRLFTAIALMLMLSLPVVAQDFDAAIEAYDSGDYATSVRIWRSLAEQGYPFAKHNLGAFYYAGLGVPQDYAEAFRWYRRAAEQGSSNAFNPLALMLYQGRGVPQDHVQAHMWFNLAAAWGSENAASNRDIVAESMTPAQVAEAQKLAREWMQKHRQ